MKIAIDIRHLTSPSLSGVGYYTLHLIQELADCSPNDSFLLFVSGSKKTRARVPVFSQKNVRVVECPLPNRILSSLILGGRTLESFLPETVDAWLFPNLNIIRTHLPYFVTVHDLSFELYPEFFTRKQRIWHQLVRTRELFRGAQHVLAVSESTKWDLENLYGISSSKITVTPLGVDERFHPNEQPSDKNFLRRYGIAFPYFLTCSTLEPRKNLDSVIAAYSDWRAESATNTPHLVIAGGKGWKMNRLLQAKEHSAFSQDIHLIGYVSDIHKPALYRHARAVFFPSFYEGFGLPALEAMASGVPTISSFTSSLGELVADAGLLVDPYNARDIEQAFTLLEDEKLRSLFTVRSLKKAKTFSWRKTAEKTLKVMHS